MPSDPPTRDGATFVSAQTLQAEPIPRPDSDTLDAAAAVSVPTRVDAASAVALDQHAFGQRYDVHRVLGAGGMGEVRLCKDKRIGREVALKVMRTHTGGDALQRFVREARVQGQLEHPAIVPVYDLGAQPDGAPFFTMKRVRGMTLEDVLDALRTGQPGAAERYTRRRLLTAFSTVCLAVDFAHSRGVLHRDLKPGNVMLGDFGEVNVLDWGLARVLDATDAMHHRGSEPTALDLVERDSHGPTQQGSLLGTPGYMAPEQVEGRIDELDARTDVYALGAILFELLCLQPLHAPATVSAVLIATVAGASDARPGQRDPALDIAPELDAICVRATALDRSGRFESARALSEAVERYLDGDRDLTRRRELAATHADAAAQAAATLATVHGEAARTARANAMGEVTRALALDPGHRGAMGTLARLLVELPDEMPPEAEAELEASAAATRREAARVSAIRYVTWIAFIPLVYLMGARSWLAADATIATLALSAIAAYALYRRGAVRAWNGLFVLALSSLALGWLAALFGPFILVPGLASTNTMFFAMHANSRMRRGIAAVGLLTMVLPWLLELLGLVPPSYGFHGDALTIYPRMADFPPTQSTLVLLGSSVALIITPTILVGRIRDALTRAERRLFVHAWHLRQMLPEEARPRARPTPPPPA